MSEFRLYPQEQHFWSFNDYRAVVEVTRRLRPWRVLEFGPGWSTLALIEGGAVQIDACEDDAHWAAVNRERLVGHYPHVALHAYTWSERLAIAGIDERRYDLALIDGPAEIARRPSVIAYCLARCAAVLVALETGEGLLLRTVCERFGSGVEIIESGPLAGAFALVRS